MYALIKFTDEDKTRIVSVEDIKHIDLSNINYKKKYLVKWDTDNYYPAQIIMAKESIEDLEMYLKNHRTRAINKNLLESASDSEDTEPVTVTNPKQKMGSKLIHETKGFKKMQQDILVAYSEATKLPPKVKTTHKEVEVENMGKKSNGHEIEEKLKNIKLENGKLKTEINDLRVQNSELSSLNIELQRTVIDHFKTMSLSKEKLMPDVGEVVGDTVHLGRGVFLQKQIFFDHWSRATSGPQFVKNIAMSVFGIDCLLKSSVTGKQCNRLKGEKKTPLDGTKLAAIEDIYKNFMEQKNIKNVDVNKEIKSIRTYIANKISDLLRTQNRKKTGNGIIDPAPIDKSDPEEEETNKVAS